MSNETLYRKVMKGKRTTYVPVAPEPEPETVLEFTEGQCLTAAGALGTMLLMVFEKNLPKMKNGSPSIVARKIKAVEAAILDLYRGTGKKIDDNIADVMARAWDTAMRLVQNEGVSDGRPFEQEAT